MKKSLISLSTLLGITCFLLNFASSASPLSSCVSVPSAIGICNANGALFEVNIDAGVTQLTLSITDGPAGYVFFPVSNEFPECKGSGLSTQTPFYLEMLSSGVTINQTGNTFEFTSATTTVLQVKLWLDCSMSNFIRTGSSGQNYFITYDWKKSGTSFCNGHISIQQTQIIDDNGTTYNFAIPAGYKENKILEFKYKYDVPAIGADLSFKWVMEGANQCNPLPFSIGDIQYSVDNFLTYNTVTGSSGVYTWTDQLVPCMGVCDLMIRAPIEITGCVTCGGNQDIKASFSYGCNVSTYSSSNFCPECDQVIETFVNFTNKLPKIEYSRDDPDDANISLGLTGTDKDRYEQPYDENCPGAPPLTWRYKIENTSTDVTAQKIIIKVKEPGGNPGLVLMANNPPLNINLNGSSASIPAPPTTYPYIGIIPECYAQLLSFDPISGFEFELNNLGPGESIYFEFQTVKCCTNDAMLLPFNQPKNFNRFALTFVTEGPCGAGDVFPPQPPPLEKILMYGGGISTYTTYGISDINMKTSFFPTLSNIIVFPENGYDQTNCSQGTASIIPNNILITDLFGDNGVDDEYDLQALGYEGLLDGTTHKPDYLGSAKLQNAYIRVKIKCDAGLQMDVDNSYILQDPKYDFIPTFKSLAVQWDPSYVKANNTIDCSIAHEYLFFYKIGDLLSNPNWVGTPNPITFLEQSAFRFNMFPCCPSGSPSDYYVEFSLLGNCGNNPVTIDPTNYDNPDFCWIPLKSETDNIQINCPGCVAPGLVAKNYYMRRMTFGYKDQDNDRLADLYPSNTQLITPAHTIADGLATYPEYDLLNLGNATHGDNLEDHFISYFRDGDPSGYTYPEMSDIHNNAFLKCLQILRTIPHAGANEMDLKVTGFDFYIDDKTSVTSGCSDCMDFENYPTTNSTKFEMHVNDVDAIGLGGVFDFDDTGNDRNFLFSINDFDIETGRTTNSNIFFPQTPDNYIVYNSNMPVTPYKFEVDEHYRLVVRYKVCGKIITAGTNYITNAGIKNDAYLIGSKLLLADAKGPSYPEMPMTKSVACTTTVTTAGYQFYSYTCANGTTNPVTQAFANSYKFKCEAYGSKLYFLSNGVGAENSYYSSGCTSYLETKSTSSIGDWATDCFGFEVKPPPFMESEWVYNLPQMPNDYVINTPGTGNLPIFRAWKPVPGPTLHHTWLTMMQQSPKH